MLEQAKSVYDLAAITVKGCNNGDASRNIKARVTVIPFVTVTPLFRLKARVTVIPFGRI
jgi:hypothetical protein